MSWEDSFGFSYDPFDPKPLQTEEQFKSLLIKTKPILERIEPLIAGVAKEPFCKGILGVRGIGKSTVLRYCAYLASKRLIVPIFVRFHPAAVARARQPEYQTLVEIMTQISQQTIINIHEMYPEVFRKYQSTLIRTAKYIGLQWEEIEGFYPDPLINPPPDEKLLRNILWGTLEFTKREDIKTLVVIDNLDKLPFEVARRFLGGAIAQPLFETLMESNCSLFVALDPIIEERIRVESDLSYLGERIKLVSLSPTEATRLILDRIEHEIGSLEKATFRLDSELIKIVCSRKKGITRDILKEFSKLFQIAYEKKTRHLSKDLYEKPELTISSTAYYELIERNAEAKKGAEKILSMVPHLSNPEISKARSFIVELYKGRQAALSPRILEMLFNQGIILSTGKTSVQASDFKLHPEVVELFEAASSVEIHPLDLFTWLTEKDIATAKTRYPTFKSKRLIKQALAILANSRRRTGKSTLLLDTAEEKHSIQWLFQDRYEEANQFAQAAYNYYGKFEAQEWEDANAREAYNLVYFTALNILLSFSYYYILFSKIPIHTKDEKYWSIIVATLREIKKSSSLVSFPLIYQIRQNQYSIKNNTWSPTLGDIDKALQDLERILVDILKIWQAMSQPFIFYDKKKKEEIEKVQEKLIEYANENNWSSIKLPEKLDFTAGRTQELLGHKKQPQFIFSNIKTGNPPEDEDFLLFFTLAEEKISEYEDLEYSKDFRKPKYYLWFISAAGFRHKARTPQLPVPRNRVNIKYLHKDELEINFKRMNIIDFLDLSGKNLEAEDIDKFQEVQEDFFIKNPNEAANNAIDYFERRMRRLIREILEYYLGTEWYSISTVPGKADIDKRLKDTMKIEHNEDDRAINPLDFTHISELRDLVIKKDNWKEFFSVIFNQSEKLCAQFRTRIDEIQDLRNRIKHSRENGSESLETEIKRILQNMIWILSHFNQYKALANIFDPARTVKVDDGRDCKLVTLGRITGKITKKDAELFDLKIRELGGQDVFKAGGRFDLRVTEFPENFGLPRMKALLMVALCKEKGLASVERKSFDTYQVKFSKRARIV